MVGPVIFDTISKYLANLGYDVTFVVNITDVDDKLIAESNRRMIPMPTVAEEMTADYLANLKAMGVDSIKTFPKATEHMDEIIRFIQDLIDKDYAYVSKGDVYFNVAKFDGYGKLSNRSLEQMSGEGGETADRKESDFDFALWKSAKPGEPAWESPWGPGRPGWHIECSVMSCALLGETFDIHGGGLDLQFPHHENEIAQSEARHGKPMAKYWMHNGLMQASNEVGKVGGRKTHSAESDAKEGDLASQEAGKISKSKGAGAFRDLLTRFPAETIRFFLLSSHYRRPIDYSEERLAEVGKGLDTFYRFFKRFTLVTGQKFYTLLSPTTRAEGDVRWNLVPTKKTLLTEVLACRARFLDAMDDDFNTGAGIGILFDLVRLLNRSIEEKKLESPVADAADRAELVDAATVLKELAQILGMFKEEPTGNVTTNDGLTDALMTILIDLRSVAKKRKDFETADKIRNDLKVAGIVLEDRPGGTTWSHG
jgi:cysteinyl-tRNA synthetase